MNILVAGGAGYVGSMLVPALIEHGYGVHVVDLLWFGNHLGPNVSIEKKDIFSCSAGQLKDYEQVIFLGGLSNDPMAEYDPALNFVQNGALPGYLAFMAKQAGVRRMIYGSSCSVYGYTENCLYDEEAPATCSYPYGISKLQGERAVLQLADSTFSAIALRQGTICGYSPRMRFDLIVNTMYKTAVAEGVIRVNNPSIWRPVLDIRDAVAAYLRAVQADEGVSGVFNVASANCTVGQVADDVKEQVETLTGQPVGFEPRHSVKDIVSHVNAHRHTYGDFEAEDYYNVRVFRRLASRGEVWAPLSPVREGGDAGRRGDRMQAADREPTGSGS